MTARFESPENPVRHINDQFVKKYLDNDVKWESFTLKLQVCPLK